MSNKPPNPPKTRWEHTDTTFFRYKNWKNGDWMNGTDNRYQCYGCECLCQKFIRKTSRGKVKIEDDEIPYRCCGVYKVTRVYTQN